MSPPMGHMKPSVQWAPVALTDRLRRVVESSLSYAS